MVLQQMCDQCCRSVCLEPFDRCCCVTCDALQAQCAGSLDSTALSLLWLLLLSIKIKPVLWQNLLVVVGMLQTSLQLHLLLLQLLLLLLL
jgi:hypothetical protein